MDSARHSSIIPALLFAAACWPTFVQAQDANGLIRGRVTNVDGAPLADVDVIAQSASLPASARTRTAGNGTFLLRALPPGDYIIAFEARGFVTTKRTTRLSAREIMAMDAELPSAPPAAPSEPVVAISEGRHMFIRWPLTAKTFRTGDVYELPLAGTPASLLTVTPGSRLMTTPALVVWNGVPVRGPRAEMTPAFSLFREALADMTLVRAAQSADIEASTVMAVASRRGGDRVAGAMMLSGGTAGRAGDALWQTGERRVRDGSAAAAIGGPLWPRHVWFFAQGEGAVEEYHQPAVAGDVVRTRDEMAGASGSLTFAWGNQHRFEFDGVHASRQTADGAPAGWRLASPAARHGEEVETRLLSAALLTRLGRGPGLELRVTEERTSSAVARSSTSSISLANPWNETRLFGSAGCGGCGDATRRIRTARAVARQFVSGAGGSHEFTVGADRVEDRSASAFEPGDRLEALVSRFADSDGALVPVLLPNGSSAVVRYPRGSTAGMTRTTSAFVSDSWRAHTGLTVDLGVRWDRARVRDATNRLLLEEDGFSPRVGLSWQPAVARGLRLSLGYARYAAGLAPLSSSLFGQPAARVHLYTGPAINAAGGPLSPEDTLSALREWALETDAPAILLDPATLRARTAGSPAVTEWSAAVSRQFRMSEIRADVVHRRDDGPRMLRAIAGETGTDPVTGADIDGGEIAGLDRLAGRSTDYVLQGHYRLGLQAVAGGSYTYHRPAGEPVASAHPWLTQALGYREFAHTGPTGLAARHRTLGWMIVQLLTDPSTGMLSVGALFRLESSPRSATLGWIDARPFTVNPGYVQPPAAVPYVFEPAGDAEGGGLWRLDFALRYTKPFGLKNRAQWFVRLDILNAADQKYRLDRLSPTRVITALQDPQRLTPFNPSTTAPVQGVHWEVDPLSGTGARTMPRAIRWLGGIRF